MLGMRGLFLCAYVVGTHSCFGKRPSTANAPQPSIGPVNPDYEYATSQAVENWHDLKFGLRIHWGEYAITGIGPESWPLHNSRNKTFMNWYWNQYKTWSPSSYDPDKWIALMRTAGVNFFDFTTKHHEGFSMYDTQTQVHDCWDLTSENVTIVPCCSDKLCKHPYSSVEAFGRDVTGELVAAAVRGGIKPGLYFSHIDWYDPDMSHRVYDGIELHGKPTTHHVMRRIDEWNAVAEVFCLNGSACNPKVYSNATLPVEWQRFVLRHRAQILEMNFPPIFNEAMRDTIMLARMLAPNTLFRGRGIGGTKEQVLKLLKAVRLHVTGGYGDYQTPEEQFPAQPLGGNWQVIFHGSDYMSYDPVAAHYVNGSFIVWHLVDIVAKGGLMQIGYGPDGRGEFHPKAVEALEFAGNWLAINGVSVYATRPLTNRWADPTTPEIRYVRSKDNTTIYATYLDYIGDKFWNSDHHTLYCIEPSESTAVYLLGLTDPYTRRSIPLNFTHDASGMIIRRPDHRYDGTGVSVPGFVFQIEDAMTQHDC